MSFFFSMFIFTLVGAASPGPVNVIAASSGARAGYRKTVPYILGASISYTFVVAVSGVGLEQISSFLPQITWLLTVFGGMFLLYMAYKIATAKGFDSEADGQSAAQASFKEGVLVQVLNPKAWLFAMSGVSLFTVGRTPAALHLIQFTLVSLVVCFAGVSVWGTVGSYIGQFLSTPRRQVGFNYTMGTLLSVAVVYMLTG